MSQRWYNKGIKKTPKKWKAVNKDKSRNKWKRKTVEKMNKAKDASKDTLKTSTELTNPKSNEKGTKEWEHKSAISSLIRVLSHHRSYKH